MLPKSLRKNFNFLHLIDVWRSFLLFSSFWLKLQPMPIVWSQRIRVNNSCWNFLNFFLSKNANFSPTLHDKSHLTQKLNFCWTNHNFPWSLWSIETIRRQQGLFYVEDSFDELFDFRSESRNYDITCICFADQFIFYVRFMLEKYEIFSIQVIHNLFYLYGENPILL